MEQLRFDVYELRPAAFELRRGGELVPMQPKPMRILAHLARNRDRVVPREELLRVAWSFDDGSPPSAASLERAIRSIRRALGDSRRRSRFVRTVNGVGYQFVAPARPATDAPLPTPEPVPPLFGQRAAG